MQISFSLLQKAHTSWFGSAFTEMSLFSQLVHMPLCECSPVFSPSFSSFFVSAPPSAVGLSGSTARARRIKSRSTSCKLVGRWRLCNELMVESRSRNPDFSDSRSDRFCCISCSVFFTLLRWLRYTNIPPITSTVIKKMATSQIFTRQFCKLNNMLFFAAA